MPELMTFQGAAEWLARRVNVPTALRSRELALAPDFPAAARAHSFFSARVAQVDILDALRAEVTELAAGRTDPASARTRLKLLLAREGWPVDDVGWSDTPPAGMTDEAWAEAKQMGNLASTRRLQLILDQNARMAQAVGREAVSQDPAIKSRWPYSRYIARMDGRERTSHGALHNTVLPKDHPFWRTHTPPWEFACRCDKEDADETDARRVGGLATVTEVQELPDGAQRVRLENPATGRVLDVLPPESGYVFDIRAPFTEPDWDRIPAGPLRDTVRAEYTRRFGGADDAVALFDAGQPRDDKGRWTDGSSIGTGSGGSAAFERNGIVESHALGGGINESELVHIEGDGDGIYKPARGEKVAGPYRDAFGTEPEFYKREVAASIVNDELGFQLVPRTVIKDGPKGRGSVQEFAEGAEDWPKAAGKGIATKDLVDINVYDAVIGNVDRHMGNVMIKPGGRLVAIDNGTAFVPTSKMMPERQFLLPSMSKMKLPPPLQQRLQGFMGKRQRVSSRLKGLLSDGEISDMFGRCQKLLDSAGSKTLFEAIADMPKGGG